MRSGEGPRSVSSLTESSSGRDEDASRTAPVLPGQSLPSSARFSLAVLDALADSIVVLDEDGVIVAVNQAWRRFAWTNGAPALAQGSVGLNYLAVCREAAGQSSGEEASAAEAGIRSVLDGVNGQFLLEYPCPSPGEERWFQMTVTPLAWPRPAVVVAHHDITQRRKAQESARRFLSRMSHELRTPLNSILGLAQVMHLNADRQGAGSDRKHLETMLDSGWQLLRIIEDILDLSAIEMRRLDFNFEDVDLRNCLAECFELIALLAQERHLEFRWSEDSWRGVRIRADAARLRQVVTNLLTNAVKYNREGGSVAISGEKRSGRVRIMVSDTGPGIPEDRVKSLFEPFGALADRPPGVSGAGIGLSVASKLTEMMGGAIGVRSVIGRGSTFWLEFPTLERPGARG